MLHWISGQTDSLVLCQSAGGVRGNLLFEWLGDPGQSWELAGLADITPFALLGTPGLSHPTQPKFRMASLLG